MLQSPGERSFLSYLIGIIPSSILVALCCILLYYLSLLNWTPTIMTSIDDFHPPIATPKAHTCKAHDISWDDDYFWLRERENEEVLKHLHGENAYTKKIMKDTENLQKTLYDEMVKRMKETDTSVPYPKDEFFYYKRTVKGLMYPIFCRKKSSLDAPEEVIFDQNIWAKDLKFSELSVMEMSPSHRYLAFGHDQVGNERYVIHVLDLQPDADVGEKNEFTEKGSLLSERIPDTYYSLEWADDHTFYYTKLDDAQRTYQAYKHVLGTPVEQDILVIEEKDDRFYLGISKSRDDKYLFIESESQITSETRYLSLDGSSTEWKVFLSRKEDVEYDVYHQNDRFLIQMRDNDSKNGKLLEVKEGDFVPDDSSNWSEVIPVRDDTQIIGVSVFKNFVVVWEREDGMQLMRILNMKSESDGFKKVDWDEDVHTVTSSKNKMYDTDVVRVSYTSLVTPPSIYDYNMVTGERKLLKVDEVHDYDKSQYESKRLYALAEDGVKIPISMVHKKGIELNGENPFLLYGYGSYGITVDPRFRSSHISLLDRGFVFAIAHIRGGGALGRLWYEEGKFLKKKNTFTDFISCAKKIIELNYTKPSKLVAQGASAGGLLMGAVFNMAPELFNSIVAGVPFVDVINTMLDETIPLTVIEYDEWGNPNERDYFTYMRSYSPYDNLRACDYPNILLTSGLNDPRVQYWEPAKFAAKLRKLRTNDKLTILKMYMEEGHAGASGRYDRLKEIAFEFSFILKTLGMMNE